METITREKQITEFLCALRTEVDIMNCLTDYDIEDLNNLEVEDGYFDYLCELLHNCNAFEVDIIYYDNAMEYLSKYDNSLKESLEIAADYGCETRNLNSEKLASLLATRKATEDFNTKEDEINEFFNNLNN